MVAKTNHQKKKWWQTKKVVNSSLLPSLHPSISVSSFAYFPSLFYSISHPHDPIPMPSSPGLPPECILPIAEHLLCCYDYGTLSSLIIASKAMFTLIAPIAFGEPFVPFNITTDASHIGQRTPGRKLCRTLLNSRPVKQLPKLLQLVYFPEYSAQGCGEYDPTSPLLLDYSSYIRHLHFNVSIPLHPDFNAHLPSKQVLPLEELVVPEITKNVDRYLVEDHQIVLGPLHRLNTYSRLLDVHLRVTLTWTLCEPILEQIQSIDIPLSDIDRYLSVVHRFRSLSSVNFIDDFALDCPERQFPVASDGLWACPGHSETQGFGDR